MTGVFIGERGERFRHRDRVDIGGKRPCDDRGRDRSDAAARQGTPRIAGHHQKQEEARKDCSLEPLEAEWPAAPLISDFWTPQL